MTDRPYTTGVYLLRCFELGLKVDDLHALEYGTVLDMLTERGNDHEEYTPLANQADMDRF